MVSAFITFMVGIAFMVFITFMGETFLNLSHNLFQTKGRLVKMVGQNGAKFESFKKLKKIAFYPKRRTFRRNSMGDV